MKPWTLFGLVPLACLLSQPVMAERTVECRSHDDQYHECDAGPLSRPALVHQVSSKSCILNRSWGYNPGSDRIWVSNGCGGIFADPHGYHHGRPNTSDAGARLYDGNGFDVGLAAGAVLGAAVVAATEDHHK